MKTCTKCDGYMPDRNFYSIGSNRLMSECKQCNLRRKADAYVPKQRRNINLGRDSAGKLRGNQHEPD